MEDVMNVLRVSTALLSCSKWYANTSRAGAVGTIAPGGYGVAITWGLRVNIFFRWLRTDDIA